MIPKGRISVLRAYCDYSLASSVLIRKLYSMEYEILTLCRCCINVCTLGRGVFAFATALSCIICAYLTLVCMILHACVETISFPDFSDVILGYMHELSYVQLFNAHVS